MQKGGPKPPFVEFPVQLTEPVSALQAALTRCQKL